MTDKEMIEQMARELCNIYNADKECCFDDRKCTSSCLWYHQATRLYNANYRKVGEREIANADLEATNKRLEKEVKSLERGLAILQQKYEELGVEITKHTSVEHSLDAPITSLVDYITIPHQRIAIPRKIIGERQ